MRSLSRRDEALLVRLADDTLRGRRREQAEARAREIPGAERLIERQRRVARALRPEPLEQTLAPPTMWWRPWFAGAAILASILLLLVSLLPDREGSTIGRAADRATLPATGPPPASTGSMLRAGVEGVRFPDWGKQFGWHETGMRRDELDGRPTRTVFYEHEGHRIAYTIISGPQLPRPEWAHVVNRDGVEIALYHDSNHGGHDIAVFERGGRTCVLAGHVEKRSTLIKLAAWRAAA